MKLKEFIDNFIEHNSIIRLLYKCPGGHKVVLNDWSDVSMDWKTSWGKGIYADYINHEVIGVASILCSKYPDAINIVIEEIPVDMIRDSKIDQIINL